jgi:hypothetical protein
MNFLGKGGLGKEHRIPLVRIRCMTDRRYKELKQLWKGQGYSATVAWTESRFYASKLEKDFEKRPYTKTNPRTDVYDCRLSFVFYDKDTEILRITFVQYQPIMLINGQPYKRDSNVLQTLLPILPHDAYESFSKITVQQYFNAW